MMQRSPPGFENMKMSQPMMPIPGYAKPRFNAPPMRGASPPMEYLDPGLAQRKPKSKRSCQNIIQPLVTDTDFKLDLHYDKVMLLILISIGHE